MYICILMAEFLIDIADTTLFLINEMSPYLLLGLLIAGVLHEFVKPKAIKHFLGKENLRSVINAAILGIPLPLCSCGVIPTGISIYKDGASKGATISFLISTPQTGVDSILATYSIVGLPFAILRPIIALITGIIGGTTSNILDSDRNKSLIVTDAKTDNSKPDKNPVFRIFRYAFSDFLEDIAGWLMLGIVIAVAINIVVPDNFFSTYVQNDLLGMVLILIVSLPMYICATGSVPIAAVLMMKGLSPGAALVFLMAGPATNIATMTVIAKAMGKKSLSIYLTAIILGSIGIGILTDYLLPREWFLVASESANFHQGHLIPQWISYFSSILLFVLILRIYYMKYFVVKALTKSRSEHQQITIRVKGMNCNHCKMSIEKRLMQITGIKSVAVDLLKQQAVIEGDNLNIDQIKTGIEELGFVFDGTVYRSQP
jgi:uncharacterized protein